MNLFRNLLFWIVLALLGALAAQLLLADPGYVLVRFRGYDYETTVAAVALVGREMSDPIGTEFGMAADEIAYGATLEQAVERMSERCQHADVDLFAATVRLQEKTGGNLTGLLKLNANTVRDRHKMRLKIKAASSEGRASAMILTAAPFIALTMIVLMAPNFYGEVIHEPMVKYGLAGLGFWVFLGNLIMRRMIDMRL